MCDLDDSLLLAGGAPQMALAVVRLAVAAANGSHHRLALSRALALRYAVLGDHTLLTVAALHAAAWVHARTAFASIDYP